MQKKKYCIDLNPRWPSWQNII